MASETPTQPQDQTTDDANPRTPADALSLVANAQPSEVGPRSAHLASEWFLDAEAQQAETVASAVVPMNVAPAGAPERIVDFRLQVLDRERIEAIRRECTARRSDGTDEVNGMEANLRMVVESLIDPPIRTDPNFRVVRGQTYMDPADALKARLAHKPGLIDQLAGRVTDISGYNTADTKEVKAAGNS